MKMRYLLSDIYKLNIIIILNYIAIHLIYFKFDLRNHNKECGPYPIFSKYIMYIN